MNTVMSLRRLELEPIMKVTLSRGINQSHGLDMTVTLRCAMIDSQMQCSVAMYTRASEVYQGPHVGYIGGRRVVVCTRD